MITPEKVAERVALIDRIADDFEGAHSEEDNLYRDVLMSIVAGSPHPQQLAIEALRSQQIHFPRYCA